MRSQMLTLFLALLVVVTLSCTDTSINTNPQDFTLHILKETDQTNVWRYATFLVDLDKLELEDAPLVTGDDIESFGPKVIRLRKAVSLPRPATATGLYFVIVVSGKREVLGHFLPAISSCGRESTTTELMLPKSQVKEIRIPEHSRSLNAYLRELYRQKKYKGVSNKNIRK